MSLSDASETPLRIAFVLNALATGGAEIHTVGLARALADRGYDCQLIPLLPLAQIDPQGLPVDPVGGNGLADRGALRRLADRLNAFEPDVIVAVNGRPAACVQLAQMIGGARKRPVAMVYHTTRLLDMRQKLQFAAHLPFVNRSDALIYVSHNQRAYCTRQGMRGARVLAIHNGIDGARFHPAARQQHREPMRAHLGIGAGDLVIGLSAAFRPEKNHAQAIEALAMLGARGVSARLLLLGDGPERAQIEAKAQQMGVADRVILAGRQADVVPWLSACDIGILTSTAVETFSLAALEFMGLGVPGVLSDLGGASEMVRDGVNGHLFPVGDTPALLSALMGMTDADVRLRMGAAAAERVKAEFTQTDMIDRYISVFKELKDHAEDHDHSAGSASVHRRRHG